MEKVGFSLQLSGQTPSWKRVRVGTQNREVIQTLQRNTTYWFVPPDMICFLHYIMQGYLQRDSIVHNGLIPPISILNQENGPPAC